MLRRRLASLFWREAEGVGWSVKKKKLFERSEFFFFSVTPDRSSQKSAALIFSFVTFSFASRQKKSKESINKKRVNKLDKNCKKFRKIY